PPDPSAGRIQQPHHGGATKQPAPAPPFRSPLPLNLLRHPPLGAFRPSASSSVDLGWSILPVGAWLDRPAPQLRRQRTCHPAHLPGTPVRFSATPCSSYPLNHTFVEVSSIKEIIILSM
uniref:Uncharacterized protein n=1 Tax=Aegilops tauschii subsp. strangulata TaxID=200361 RepID=A0A453D984_AEGTS